MEVVLERVLQSDDKKSKLKPELDKQVMSYSLEERYSIYNLVGSSFFIKSLANT